MGLQKNFKMLVSQRRFAPRIKGVSRLKQLVSQIQAIRQIADGLSGNDQKSFLAEVALLEGNLNAAVARLKTSEPLEASAIASVVDGLWHRVEGKLTFVKAAVENEEKRKKKEEEEGTKRRREAEERERI